MTSSLLHNAVSDISKDVLALKESESVSIWVNASTCGRSQLVKVLVQCDNVCVLLYVVQFMSKISCRVIFVYIVPGVVRNFTVIVIGEERIFQLTWQVSASVSSPGHYHTEVLKPQ